MEHAELFPTCSTDVTTRTKVHFDKLLAAWLVSKFSDSYGSWNSTGFTTAIYLGLHFDKRLTWRENVTKTRKHLDLKTRELIWLIGKHSPLSLTNKLLIYKTVLKLIWTYGLALWGCAASSNLAIIQRYQAKILRQITNAPWYVTNHTLHKDLRIPQVQTVLQELTDTNHTALQSHPNPLMAQILAPPNSRRLLRRWTLDVMT